MPLLAPQSPNFLGIPLLLEPYFNDISLGFATGFVIDRNAMAYLITNKHVVTGKDIFTGNYINSQTLAAPNKLGIWSPTSNWETVTHGIWRRYTYPAEYSLHFVPLLNAETEQRLWLEHESLEHCDVIALPLNDETINYITLEKHIEHGPMVLDLAREVSIIGFPLGLSATGRESAQKVPVCKTGHIATDPYHNYDNLPIFLVDAITGKGMSGSPVFANGGGGYRTLSGRVHGADEIVEFIGIYSGRVVREYEAMNIGMVWRASLIEQIIRKD